MGRSSNCLKILYFSIGMYYEGIVYSEYLSYPQVHLTGWGDVLQSAQSRQAVLWVVGIKIIHLLDKYHSIYSVEWTHIISGHSSAVPRANEHARDVPGMKLCSATTPIQYELPDLACGWTKSHSGHISGMLVCTGNCTGASKNYISPFH